MSELKESGSPIEMNLLGRDLEIRGTDFSGMEPVFIREKCAPDEDLDFLNDLLFAIILKDSEYPSCWNTGQWTDDAIRQEKELAIEFIKRYKNDILKGELRAFREIRIWLKDKNPNGYLWGVVDNTEIRKLEPSGNFKSWLVEAFRNPQLAG